MKEEFIQKEIKRLQGIPKYANSKNLRAMAESKWVEPIKIKLKPKKENIKKIEIEIEDES